MGFTRLLKESHGKTLNVMSSDYSLVLLTVDFTSLCTAAVVEIMSL